MRQTLTSNIISKKVIREVQLETLKTTSDAVMQSAGIKGSNTMILSERFPEYSKDGKRILEHIKYFGKLENDIVDQLTEIINHVVTTVGDGTTCATRMSYYIFKYLCEIEDKLPDGVTSYDLITEFNKVATQIRDGIARMGREATLEDIYKICMISTNGNEKISKEIYSMYEKFGMGVYINLGTCNEVDNMVKAYDGITLEKGCTSEAYYNTDNKECIIKNAKIYIFEDPIDNEEMIALFTRIVYENIIDPYTKLAQARQAGRANYMPEYAPTVILAPSISRDVSSMLEELETMLYQYDQNGALYEKPPIAIITKLNRYIDQVYDISKLCGCKTIKKYIDPTVQQRDIEAGNAPTPDTVTSFCGFAEEVSCNKNKTKFTNPANMYEKDADGNYVLDEDGNPTFSSIYNGLIGSLEGQIESLKDDNSDVATIAIAKRRLNALKCNNVDYLIGGVGIADRNSDYDLAEDAVLNCRSAAVDGVGYGASFMGLKSTLEISIPGYDDNTLRGMCIGVLVKAYTSMVKELYGTCLSSEEVETYFAKSLDEGMPINLKTKEFDGAVLSSIKSDDAILEGVSKIVTIMFTANQALFPSVTGNVYKDYTDED